jgi:DNA-binding transcriptional MerR regulator
LTLESITGFTLFFVDDNSAQRSWFLPGELAAAAGVSTDSLRHYERKGVLPRPPRTANGYRRYPASALERIKLIRSSLAIGFTLDELARILSERDKGGTPCREVHALAVNKLSDLDEQIRALAELRKRLRTVVDDWNERLLGAGSMKQARLLDILSSSSSVTSARLNARRKLSPAKNRRNGEK